MKFSAATIAFLLPLLQSHASAGVSQDFSVVKRADDYKLTAVFGGPHGDDYGRICSSRLTDHQCVLNSVVR